jgi:hypothetical protein
MIPSLFVTPGKALNGSGPAGGVQICTREYLETLKAAGLEIEVAAYEADRRWTTRLRHRLWPRPYADYLPPRLADQIVKKAGSHVRFVFLNCVATAPLAAAVRARLPPTCQIVLLSHGAESTDSFHDLRYSEGRTPFTRASKSAMLKFARQIIAEGQQRRFIDHTLCLSPLDMILEQWLGARSVEWLPRTVPERSLIWTPNPCRIGFVGTLGHTPNREGLELFLCELQKLGLPEVRVRVVGGPPAAGAWFTKRYDSVDYLGPMADGDLEREASTWGCFIHPIFCAARGCSTKLAVAIGWHIPVLTTPQGHRGYVWREGDLPVESSPRGFAKRALEILENSTGRQVRREVIRVARSTPKLEEVAQQVSKLLFDGDASGSHSRPVRYQDSDTDALAKAIVGLR